MINIYDEKIKLINRNKSRIKKKRNIPYKFKYFLKNIIYNKQTLLKEISY